MKFRRFNVSRADDPEIPLVDLADIFADDELVELLRTSGSAPDHQADGPPDKLLDLLAGWRADALAAPLPLLPLVPTMPPRSARAGRSGLERSGLERSGLGHRRSLRPVVAIVGAIAGMMLGSAVVSAREAQPGDALFALTTVVWPREAEVANAIVDVSVAAESAETALGSDDAGAAQSSLARAQEALNNVDEADRPAALKAKLDDLRFQLDRQPTSSAEPAAGSQATPSVTGVQEVAAAPPAPQNPSDSAASGKAAPPSTQTSTAAPPAPSTTEAGAPSATPTSAAATGSSASSAPATGTSPPLSTNAPDTSSPAETTSGITSSQEAVPGLPRATPLPNTVLLGTRTVDGQEGIYPIDATTGVVGKELMTHPTDQLYPNLSPDRELVVYAEASAVSQLRSVAVDGTGDRQLFTASTVGCQEIRRPAWNPIDGTELAVVCVGVDGTNQLKLVGVDGTVRSTLHLGMAFIDGVSFSPDGKTLLYWGSGGALFRQPADGSGNPQQITTPGAANDGDATFAPDGETIVFSRTTTVSDGGAVSQIFTVQADGVGLTPVTDGTSIDQDPAVSPDGTQVAFRSNRNNAAGTSDVQIWVIGIDGTGLRQLGIGSPGISSGPLTWCHR